MRKETRKKKRKKQTVLQPWKRKSLKTLKKNQRSNCQLWIAVSSPPSSLSSSLSSLSSSLGKSQFHPYTLVLQYKPYSPDKKSYSYLLLVSVLPHFKDCVG